MLRKRFLKGFSLLEISLVIVVAGAMTFAGWQQYKNAQVRINMAKVEASVVKIMEGLNKYYYENCGTDVETVESNLKSDLGLVVNEGQLAKEMGKVNVSYEAFYTNDEAQVFPQSSPTQNYDCIGGESYCEDYYLLVTVSLSGGGISASQKEFYAARLGAEYRTAAPHSGKLVWIQKPRVAMNERLNLLSNELKQFRKAELDEDAGCVH